jgi:hypothetical protein
MIEEGKKTTIPIIETMTNIMNYLAVSFYESQFTHQDQQAWSIVKEVYDRISNTPSVSPSVRDIQEFYDAIVLLRRVTETDDPVYHTYMREIRQYYTKTAV